MTEFKLETEMTETFERLLATGSFFTETSYKKEFKGLVGIPDFVLGSAEAEPLFLTAIELKLANWRRALNQAYRYRSFSHQAYVVIDESNVHRVQRDLFEQYNVGLASLSPDGILRRLFEPTITEPFSPDLSTRARAMFADIQESCRIQESSEESSTPLAAF